MIIMGSLKSPKRSRWYKGFKPDVEDYPFKPISCLGKSGKESMLRNNNIFMTLSDGDKLDSSSDREDRLSKKSKPHRSFSRVLKAVLFQSSMAKKKRSIKSGQKTSYRPSKLDKIFNPFRNKKSSSSSYRESLDDCFRTDSSRSALFSTSSSTTAASSSLPSSRASSVASNSRSASERKRSGLIDLKQLNQKPTTIYSNKTNGYCNSNVGLYFLLICLVALIFWGKAFAVFCTSTCLFLIPCRLKRFNDQSAVNNNAADYSIDIDSDEYKKKVIMEGLLERNRTSRTL